MRVVFVSHEYPPQCGGGIGTYVSTMARVLADHDHGVTVLSVTDRRWPQREWDRQVEVVRLPTAVVRGAEPMATLRFWQSRADAVAQLLTRMMQSGPIDVIEFADYRGEGVTFLISTAPSDRPISVVRLHTPLRILEKYNTGHPRYPVLESFEDQAILHADHVVSPSVALIREMRQHLPDLRNVDLSPHPADATFLEIPVGQIPEKSHVLYVGRLEERKGVKILIEAAPAFLDAIPEAMIHLVGGDTQVSAKIPSMRTYLLDILPERYHSRVIFHGVVPRETLIHHYLSARVCVFPSLFENFPNTCLEAMALARPVIGTDNSGMAEMIEDGKSGRITRSGDAEELAAALIDLYQQPEGIRHTMGAEARQRIHKTYRPERIAQQVESLYQGYIPASGASTTGKASVAASAVHTTPEQPTVAVVIPCYNHGTFIREALTSVAAQEWRNTECVVVDDGSTDQQTIKTLQQLEQEGIRILRQDNQGLSAARNTGVRATDASFFVPLDADDKIAPQFIAKLVSPLLKDASLGYCYSHVAFFGAASGVWPCAQYDPRQLMVENMSVATAVVRRSAFDLVNGYQPDMLYGFEDWDFWLALLSVGYHGQCIPEPLFMYRKHRPGLSMLDQTQQHRAEMIRKMVEHHRDLFASMLEVSMSDKDAMFFQAHMEAWRLRESTGRPAEGIPTPKDDDLYKTLQAQAELDYIENSGSWQTIQKLKRSRPYRAYARLVYGKGRNTTDQATDPREKLAAIKQSRFYRCLRMVKRTNLYKAYARRKYGPDFVNPWPD